MNDFLQVLSFSIFPILSTIIYATVIPPMGAILYLKNEIMLSIALPSFGSAAVAFCILIGVAENTMLQYVLVIIFIFVMLNLLSVVYDKAGSLKKRELLLAAVFVSGNAFTYLFMAISPHVNANISHLLSGEVLAIQLNHCVLIFIASGLLLAIAYPFRGVIYAFCLDEESFVINIRHYKWWIVAYRLILACWMTTSILLIGPLLTTTLLILPPLFSEKVSGMDRFFAMNIIIGVISVITGFITALIIDFPPTYLISITFLIIGGVGILLAPK
ncbi:MAG: zinc transport system permease protein [Candidatus Magnetoglobus multicellularis str. Araruama]|uniref:Zinc transport system permease protein n=1 Tax=Candidatus Magnetoglobus multicellularis str. Araruama TaxID=890399 RepID=A0A1V1P827_9BACT|nr:MAG: zinc transport system permease protein [Candidatus Magnetoglobus multicellularis str. Araruama]